MRFILLSLVAMLLSHKAVYALDSADTTKAKHLKTHKVSQAIIPPRFANGDVQQYVSENLRYPDAAIENGVEGRVIVRLLIDETGHVVDPQIASQRLGVGCDEEALRVVKAMPLWKPATYKHRPVRYVYELPVEFRLE